MIEFLDRIASDQQLQVRLAWLWLAAFTLPDTATRGAWLDRMQERGFLALPSGPQSIRFRMPLSVSAGEVDRALEILADCAKVG